MRPSPRTTARVPRSPSARNGCACWSSSRTHAGSIATCATRWRARTPNRFELTELGRRSLLTKLADTQDDNVEVWESLPGFQWYAPVLRARARSDVLCVHKDVANEYGRLPLLVTRSFGAGKV